MQANRLHYSDYIIISRWALVASWSRDTRKTANCIENSCIPGLISIHTHSEGVSVPISPYFRVKSDELGVVTPSADVKREKQTITSLIVSWPVYQDDLGFRINYNRNKDALKSTRLQMTLQR